VSKPERDKRRQEEESRREKQKRPPVHPHDEGKTVTLRRAGKREDDGGLWGGGSPGEKGVKAPLSRGRKREPLTSVLPEQKGKHRAATLKKEKKKEARW